MHKYQYTQVDPRTMLAPLKDFAHLHLTLTLQLIFPIATDSKTPSKCPCCEANMCIHQLRMQAVSLLLKMFSLFHGLRTIPTFSMLEMPDGWMDGRTNGWTDGWI